MKPRTIEFVIADGERARFVTFDSKKTFRTRRLLESSSAHQQSSDLGTDRPPQTMESATGTGHAITPRHDLHEMEKEKFARQVAREVDQASIGGVFDGVVLVAPVRTLNTIRDALDAATLAKLVGALQKDLTKVPDHELAPHLEAWM